MSDLLSISDAIFAIQDPVQALQAVGQLTHPSKAVDGVDLSLVDRQSLAYLLTIIHKDLANAVAEAQALVESAIENSKTSSSTGDVATAPPPPVHCLPVPPCPFRRRKE